MRDVPLSEIRFLLKRGLQGLSASTLRDMKGAADKRERALDLAADAMLEPFKRLTVQAPDPPGSAFEAGRG